MSRDGCYYDVFERKCEFHVYMHKRLRYVVSGVGGKLLRILFRHMVDIHARRFAASVVAS